MARRNQPVIPDQLLNRRLGGADAKTAFEKDGLLDVPALRALELPSLVLSLAAGGGLVLAVRSFQHSLTRVFVIPYYLLMSDRRNS